ncbi:MAG: DnaA regulatory inactivator Hda [Alphaproteobacteria bacterium]|jgi:DnaA regulatory inactivator Hda
MVLNRTRDALTSERQILLSFPERKDFALENFLVLPTNNLGYMSVGQFPQIAGDVLVVYGEKGVGKSHLFSTYVERTGAKILTKSELKLPLDLDYNNFAIDGIDDLTEGQQEALFHLFNHVKSSAGSLLVIARSAVAKMDILADLKSRLLTAPQIEIEPPKDVHLEVFLVKYASDRQMFLDPKVSNYILKNCERNLSHIEAIVAKLDSLSLEQKRKITVPLVRQVFNAPL